MENDFSDIDEKAAQNWFETGIPWRTLTVIKSLSQWTEECHTLAKEKGWWPGGIRNIPELLCLIHSEISEALEAYRHGNSENFREEIADTFIRLFDLCGGLNVDIETEITKKHEINKQREWRHGGKRC